MSVVSVYVFLSTIISPELHVHLRHFMHTCIIHGRGCGSVLLLRLSDMLHISSFVDDVIFAH